MNNLLNLAVEAHGGLRRWRHLRTMRANVSITGALWHQKRKADVLKNAYVEARLHDQRVLTHLIDQKFGENGLLRRYEYTVDILGGARGLNYATDYQNVSGIMVPTKRKVYPTDAMKQKVAEPILVAIDLSHIEFAAG